MKHDQEEFKFAGIPTFMRAPYLGLDELEGSDVGVLGAPVDFAASYRQGAKNAPRSIREHSHWDRIEGLDYVDLKDRSNLTSNSLRLADLGDVHIHPGDAERINDTITGAVKGIRERCFPIILGGDHSIAYANFKGILAGLPDDRKPVGILHFDAHPDVETTYLTLPRVWHGNPFRVLMDEGYLSGDRLATIGPRGVLPKKWLDYISEQGIHFFTGHEVHDRGLSSVVSDAVARLRERCKSIYISYDIDFIDPIDAPGTGTPSFGGIRAHEAVDVMRRMPKADYVGMDLVEVNPDLDPTGRTSILSCDLLWNFLAFSYQPNQK